MTASFACIDDSQYTHSVLDHAAWAASRLGIGVELLHALERHPERADSTDFSGSIGMDAGDALLTELAALDEQRARLAMAQGRRLLDAARTHLADKGIASIHTRLRHGELVDILDAEAADRALTVIGKRGVAADFAKLHLGSNLERVLRASAQPVLVASRAFREVERVLVAFDGSKGARKAVGMVACSPLTTGSECHVVMACSEDAGSAEAMAWVEDLFRDSPVACRVQVIRGDAAQVIPAYVETHDMHLLAMGAYGHSKMRELLLGSTTTTLIRRCLLPVLVVR